MANLTGDERSHYVKGMFSRIASRYDLMNRIMTFGQDIRWRKEVIRRAQLSSSRRVLDLGAGTGDLAREAIRQCPSCSAVAADFTLEMMLAGIKGANSRNLRSHQLVWTAADANQLPFPDHSFHAVVSGFLLRNVSNLEQSLKEQFRVLKPNGMMVALDTTPPPNTPLAPAIRFHMHTIIPTLGKVISGQQEAYTYLPDSTESFLEPERLAARLQETGFQDVGYCRRMLGTIAIHWGRKPGRGH